MTYTNTEQKPSQLKKKRRDPLYDDLPTGKARLLKRILIFMMVLVMPSVLWSITGLLGLNDQLDFDTYENRNKYEITEDVSLGNLTAEAEAYYNDRVPFRSILLSTDRVLNNILEFPYEHGIKPLLLLFAGGSRQETAVVSSANKDLILKVQNRILTLTGETGGQSALAGIEHEHKFHLVEHKDADYENYGYDLYRCLCGEEKKEYIDKPIDDSYFPYVDGEVVEGRFDWLFYWEEIDDYIGDDIPDENELEQAAILLNTVKAEAEASNTQFFCLVIPNKSRVFPEYMPTLDKAEPWRLSVYNDYLTTERPAPFIYLYDEMLEEKPKHDPYYQSDTHWNYYGALVGVNKIREYVGMSAIDIDQLPVNQYERLGDLSKMLGETDKEIYYKPEYRTDIQIESEFGNPDGEFGFASTGIARFHSNAENEKTVVVIGDSFQVNIMEYLPRDFAETVFIKRAFLEEYGPVYVAAADILIYECVERNFGFMPEDLTELIELIR